VIEMMAGVSRKKRQAAAAIIYHKVTLEFADKGLVGFVQKPCRLSTLKQAIKKI
jgi:hypothetical protein